MHPSSLLSYYPTYAILDEVLSYGDFDQLNLYFDLKNNLQTLYLEHAIKNVVEMTLKTRVIDTSIFTSVLSFLAFHKLYGIKKKIKVNFYIFFETGVSYYHTNLYKKYKVSRRIDDLYGLERDKRELFFDIFHKNLMLVEKACRRIPRNCVIRLPNLEADFIPYYLIRNGLVDTGENAAHIIYSNDHDLLQTVEAGNNTFIFQKSGKKKKLVKKNETMKTYFKLEKNFPDSYLPLAYSVIGDTGDDIDGINGIGPKRVMDLIEELVSLVGGIETLYENVKKGKNIFATGTISENKYMMDIVKNEEEKGIISRNLKLISFEILSRFLDDPSTIEMSKKRKFIKETLEPTLVSPMKSLKTALEMSHVFLQEEDLEVLYYGEHV